MVVIGSTALSYYLPGIIPNDLDLVATYDEAVEFRKRFNATVFYPINSGKSVFMRNARGEICEIEIAWPDSRAEKFIDFVFRVGGWKVQLGLNNDYMNGLVVPPLDVLYLLKMSHRYLKDSPHFLKTMEDIHTLRDHGCSIRPQYKLFYEDRMKDTYTYSHPKLDVAKQTFFDAEATGVEYVYDHDSLHEAVKHMVKPAYNYYKPDENEVFCDKDLFYAQPHYIRLLGVLEEAYVLALERSLIPYPGVKTSKQAFDIALMKVCTSITSGWFREFAWENYYEVQDMYSDGYVYKFDQGLANGVVKPFDKSKALY